MSKPALLREVRLRPDPDVVDALENALEKAKRGEVRSVAVAMVMDGRDHGSCYSLDEDASISQILAAIEYLKLRITGAVES